MWFLINWGDFFYNSPNGRFFLKKNKNKEIVAIWFPIIPLKKFNRQNVFKSD
jgi:hypothetical protein